MNYAEKIEAFEAVRDRFLSAVAAMSAAATTGERSETVLMQLMDEVTESQKSLDAATDALRPL